MTTHYVRLDDHKNPDGKIDWASYGKAQVDIGQVCRVCGDYMLFGGDGHPRRCAACERAEKKPGDRLDHDKMVRCPKCGHLFDPTDGEFFNAHEESTAYCPACDSEVEYVVHTHYTFTSPPRLEKGEDNATIDPAKPPGTGDGS